MNEIATKITPLRAFVFSVQPLVLSQGQLQKGLLSAHTTSSLRFGNRVGIEWEAKNPEKGVEF